MNKNQNQILSKIILPILLVAILSLASDWAIVQFRADFRVFLFLGLALASISIIIIGGKKALQIGFIIWILLFIVGYRTIPITSYLSLHPLIVLLTLLFVIFVFQIKTEFSFQPHLPVLLRIFIFFWIWGFIPGAFRGIDWSQMISDALNFYFLIPLFTIIQYLSNEKKFWQKALITFLVSGALISLLGAIEYFVPAFRTLLPGLIQSDTEGLLSQTGFLRASFAFFGANPAVLISALALPMAVLVPRFAKTKFAVVWMLILLAILCVGIYISGTRAAWLMLLVASVLLAYFNLGWLGVAFSGAAWGVVVSLLPEEALNLINSLISPMLYGQYMDTSIIKRVDRQQNALELAYNNPLGVGWSGSGWVHGDFTQVAANLGILAGILFLAWYLHTLYRGLKYYRSHKKDWIFHSLFTSFVLCGIVLATEGVQVLTQFIMPVWFVWGMLEAYLQKNTKSTSIEV